VERNRLAEKVNSLKEELDRYQKQLTQVDKDMATAYKTSEQLHDESTEELENNIANIENINHKVRANLDKDKAEEDALDYVNQYNTLSVKIDEIRQSKIDLLKNANLPLPGLSVVDGELTYEGYKWDNMSGSDQLKVSTAIVRKLNPKCGFVLLDKLEQMDVDTLKEFGEWLEQEGLQAIATRVSTGDECSIIIEDGYVAGERILDDEAPKMEAPKWKAGEF
jgi:DNA repair exonuclease SbcCD ATPase subunit